MSEPSPPDNTTTSSLKSTESAEEAAFFKSIVKDSLDGVITIAEDATIVFANEAVASLFGYSVDDLLGNSIHMLFPERDCEVSDFYQYTDDLESTGECTNIERVGRHRTGDELLLSFRLHKHTYRGQCLFTVSLRDVSEQQQQQHELEAATEKYRTLVETAPDAIFVADAKTGVIQETNQAAAELLERPVDEIEGMHQTELHPSEEAERYERLFQGHQERGGLFRENQDLTVMTANGNRVPVAINSKVTELRGRPVIQGTFRDISERKHREYALNALHETTQRMSETASSQIICTHAVTTAAEVLDFPISGIHFESEDGESLEPVATTDEVAGALGGSVPTFTPEDPFVWDVFETGEPSVIPDLQATEEGAARDTPIRSSIIVPLGEYGVFITSSESVRDFDQIDFDLVRVLAANTEAALTRAERERAIARQRDELTTLNRINAIVRDINQALVASPTRDEIEQTVCERFAVSNVYHGALVGTLSTAEQGLSVQTAAGIDETYLETVAKESTETESGAAATAIRTGTVQVIEDVQTDPAFPASIKTAAWARNYRSAACIPFGHGETMYGVLVVYAARPTVIGEREQAVFAELGEMIGHAINAAESKQLLYSDRILELEFSLSGTDSFFVTTSAELECSFTLNGVVPASNDTYIFYVTSSGVAPKDVIERAKASPSIEYVRQIQSGDIDNTFEMKIRGTKTTAQALIERGAYVRSGSITQGEGTLIAEVPANTEIRPLVEAVQAVHPSAALLAKRNREHPLHPEPDLHDELESMLTARQFEILLSAYLAGYFDYPRASTGAELAETLDISSPTFHQHLQAAQQKVLTLLFSNHNEVD
ncbi:PAS domain S-box-containing protein [Haladaptatus litoreus]|uniref:PAS domain S-box-containing protein n=1 Tax=Haladaptatus litoreus TaxID=553468 RepID=A0A1N6W4Y3_9EURY|nr:bacterio-opsin activator domain-containing protein [Haladaptatus litoreus]SIQ85179.1 PAS domain S-box-containing protein [Haladaptatus litoreus]